MSFIEEITFFLFCGKPFQVYFVAQLAWRLMAVLHVLFQELPGIHAHEVQPVQRRPLYPGPEQPSIRHHPWSGPLLHRTQTPHQRSRTLVLALSCAGSNSLIGQNTAVLSAMGGNIQPRDMPLKNEGFFNTISNNVHKLFGSSYF